MIGAPSATALNSPPFKRPAFIDCENCNITEDASAPVAPDSFSANPTPSTTPIVSLADLPRFIIGVAIRLYSSTESSSGILILCASVRSSC